MVQVTNWPAARLNQDAVTTDSNYLTVDEMIAHLQMISWQGKGHYRLTGEGASGKPCYFNSWPTEVHDTARIVDLVPYGRSAKRDLPL